MEGGRCGGSPVVVSNTMRQTQAPGQCGSLGRERGLSCRTFESRHQYLTLVFVSWDYISLSNSISPSKIVMLWKWKLGHCPRQCDIVTARERLRHRYVWQVTENMTLSIRMLALAPYRSPLQHCQAPLASHLTPNTGLGYNSIAFQVSSLLCT